MIGKVIIIGDDSKHKVENFVKTVNSIAPDETGNVDIEINKDELLAQILEKNIIEEKTNEIFYFDLYHTPEGLGFGFFNASHLQNFNFLSKTLNDESKFYIKSSADFGLLLGNGEREDLATGEKLPSTLSEEIPIKKGVNDITEALKQWGNSPNFEKVYKASSFLDFIKTGDDDRYSLINVELSDSEIKEEIIRYRALRDHFVKLYITRPVKTSIFNKLLHFSTEDVYLPLMSTYSRGEYFSDKLAFRLINSTHIDRFFNLLESDKKLKIIIDTPAPLNNFKFMADSRDNEHKESPTVNLDIGDNDVTDLFLNFLNHLDENVNKLYRYIDADIFVDFDNPDVKQRFSSIGFDRYHLSNIFLRVETEKSIQEILKYVHKEIRESIKRVNYEHPDIDRNVWIPVPKNDIHNKNIDSLTEFISAQNEIIKKLVSAINDLKGDSSVELNSLLEENIKLTKL